ncbi:MULTISPECIES: SO_0444 family Cu/Zn efflux transporter [Dethiosulfovibrio]|uniref:SO_0444 family Cu/Zn efflux transporter n=2 Tax=Dethiosulfovibrio TaxID=47054 RepID=A0ABS9ER64_9BACT|nr:MULTISPECIES: SO_0444 family Cu/Zn efflux transporter [Dethiosulfovibrio]MCF4115192.1 SO_0444 family Cu/Zn efflux transporter [Dethiosulfovibrio russensis]MCF4143655.1 SO_0444 family Cu/Zn efflux transporter [Dethiosulfovibrio marinus]MCF4146110.1 SO_0444 family Cu/Zn efflux transporter [Dethiosulfovibrio acidaminovorans]
MNFTVEIVKEAGHMFLDAAPYMLIGIMLSGFLKAFIDPGWVNRFLGGRGVAPVVRASLAGIPLPLCSCGVIPAAAGLRKQGASASATTAFLISTPESGVDSIAMSYALLDPIMTVARPIVAFISAFTAGILSVFFGGEEEDKNTKERPDVTCSSCHGHHEHDHGHIRDGEHHSIRDKIIDGLRFAVFDIWGDLAGAFFLGIALSGIIAVAVPQTFLEGSLGGGIGSMLIMLVAGIPMYICATSSTPLAAALILKGVSPGAALVFLMAGPATNVSAIPVLHRILGTKRLLIYLGSIAVVSVASGLALDGLYGFLGTSAQATVGQTEEILSPWISWGSSTLLVALWIMSRGSRGIPRFFRFFPKRG